ncbi:MAG: hypothetical protein IT457_09165 [Planctomycetes bacterium]|nr:hypothetical protein [Planctomycetota bacterium]
MRQLEATVLDLDVFGVNLRGGSGPAGPARLRDQCGPGPTLFAFLRHLG